MTIFCFDVDGTLIKSANASVFKRRRSYGETYPFDAANLDIVELIPLLAQLSSVKIVVWSGGGKDYAQKWVERLQIEQWVWRVASKTEKSDIEKYGTIIAIDDQDVELGTVNIQI